MNAPLIPFEEGWSTVETGISKLKKILEGVGELELEFSREEYMTLYTTIYNMCSQKPPYGCSHLLYDMYKEELIEYINSTVLPSLREKHGEFTLQELAKCWSNYKVVVRWFLRSFDYLDRFFVPSMSLPPLQEVGFICFRDLVYEETKGRAKDAVIALINQEREGQQIDQGLLKNVLAMHVEIGMGQIDYYEKDFEAFMLADSADYYARKALNWIKGSDYMLKVEDSLKKENDRVGHYLDSSSRPKLIEIVENELLVNYSSQLIENEHSGCLALLRDNKVDDLRKMYKLLSNILKGPELDPIVKIFMQYVTELTRVQEADDAASNNYVTELTRVQEADDAASNNVFVRELIGWHDKCVTYVVECFSNHNQFRKALSKVFVVLCNKTVAGCSSAELLSAYCHNILKEGSSEKLGDKAIKETLDTVLYFLRWYLEDKDLFVEFYRTNLSNRLLFETRSYDHERYFLSKLTDERFRLQKTRMETMVRDLALTMETRSEFHMYLSNNPLARPGIGFTNTVLTANVWPPYKSSDICLPAEMVKCVDVFTEFYKGKTTGPPRKLTWIHSLGRCIVTGYFDTKPIELYLRTYQSAVLLLFNASEELSYSEIKTQLNLADADVVGSLESLACAKYEILTKVPSSRTVSKTDVFRFNSKFTHDMKMINMICIPNMDERQKVVEDVEDDRRHAIDASIVRIMKSRKVLDYQQLVSQCEVDLEQRGNKFKPDRKVINKRIADLIEREYLEKDEENPLQYKYLP